MCEQAHLFNEDFALHYQFLGSMLGKALYEGLLVELPFAGFFLCKLAGRGRGMVGVHHLASFDPELYRYVCRSCDVCCWFMFTVCLCDTDTSSL